MKRILLIVGLSFAPMAHATEIHESINEPALTYDVNYDQYVDSMVDKKVSAVMAYSIATIPTNTFTDGRLASGSITVAVTSTLISGGDYATVNGFKFRAGYKNVIGDAAGLYTSIFGVTSTAAGTAANLAYVINRHPGLSSIISAATSSAIITLTSKLPDGVAYALTSVSDTKLSLSGATMTGGILSAIDATNDLITTSAHGLETGEGVVYSTGTNGSITGLTWGNTYYIIKVSSSKYKFALSKADAVAGTAVDISYTPGATNHTFTLSPVVWGSSTAGAKWQQSNDGSHFFDVPSISSVSVTSSNTSETITGWDFGFFDYRWLRLKFTGPAAGGLNLKVDINKKQ
jgi:hypothetical protein